MTNDKKRYFLKSNPPQSSFTLDMTDEERDIMLKHIDYWQPHLNDGTIIVYSPVMDPKGGYGISVMRRDSEEHLKELTDGDPANGLCSFGYYRMRAVTK